MHDGLIDADIYRLTKAASEASTAEERGKLETSTDANAQVLAANHVAASLEAVERSLELLKMPFSKLRD
jgi:hypothetical protein